MGLAAVACLVLAAVVAVRWTTHRADALGRPNAFPVVGVVLPLVLCVGLAVPVARTALLEHRLSAVASDLAGRRVGVDCTGAGADLVHAGQDVGHVDVGPDGTPSDVAVLQHRVCADLQHWLSHRGDRTARPDVDGAVAVHVLTHEAMHLRGLLDEAAADCAAIQRDSRTARLLGATPQQAARVARAYWLVTYPTMTEPYRSPECRPGGALDERLPDAPWTADVTA